MELAALSHLAFHPHRSPHQLHQCSGNGKPQSGSTIFASSRAIDLLESLEDRLLLLLRNTDTSIGHEEMQIEGQLTLGLSLNVQHHLTFVRELNRITDRLMMICRRRVGSPKTRSGRSA